MTISEPVTFYLSPSLKGSSFVVGGVVFTSVFFFFFLTSNVYVFLDSFCYLHLKRTAACSSKLK